MSARACAWRKSFRIMSSWSAAECAKRSPGRRGRELRRLLRKPRNPLPRESPNPLRHNPLRRNPRKPPPPEPQNRLLQKLQNRLLRKLQNPSFREEGDPLAGKMTAIKFHGFQMMSPSLVHGALKDHLCL